MKKIHAIAVVVLLAYLTLLIVNVPPLVRSDHVSVNWNLLQISALGFLISTAYVAGVVVLKKQMNVSGVHRAILMVEAAGIATVSALCLFRALRFFGIA